MTLGHVPGAQRIGVFGGTFDPIHNGHLAAIEEVRYALALDRVLFVPNNVPPHKSHSVVAPVMDRVAMARLAINANPAFDLSTIELERPGPSYSLDTMRELRRRHPTDTSLHFILGYDGLADLPNWHEPCALLDEFQLVVMDRPISTSLDGNSLRDSGRPNVPLAAWENLEALYPRVRERVTEVHVPQLAIASVDIRRRVAEGRPIRYQVPADVEAYIHAHGLYTSASAPL